MYKKIWAAYRMENGIPPQAKFEIEIIKDQKITVEYISENKLLDSYDIMIDGFGKIKIVVEFLQNRRIINIDVYINEVIYDINLKEELNDIFVKWKSLLKISGEMHFLSLL